MAPEPKKPYLPGDEVWNDPRAEDVLRYLNNIRQRRGMPPLLREDPSTADIVRQRLLEADRQKRTLLWWQRRLLGRD